MSSVSESEHDQHSSFIKTPQQLVVVILLSFLVPIFGIVLLVQLVVSAPSADPNALKPEAVSTVIPGIRNIRQAELNCAVSDQKPMSDELERKLRPHHWRRAFWYGGK